jgi:hypothetical protein
MSDRIDAIRRRELWALSASEKARVIALETRSGVQIGRGKSPGSAPGRASRVWADAEARVQREETAAARVREQELQDKADAKAARKAKGWW